MSDNPFAAPAPPGEGIQWQEFNGALLLIEPQEEQKGIQTKFGTADAVRAHVSVVDGPKAGETYLDTLIFPKLLAQQTRSRIGEKLLGRLGQGVAKNGQSPPWLLNEATPQDIELGKQWMANSQPQPTSAAPPQPQGQQAGNVPF